MGTFLGVPVDRITLRTWILIIAPTTLDWVLDSVADDAGIV
jgi:hypothetical protein